MKSKFYLLLFALLVGANYSSVSARTLRILIIEMQGRSGEQQGLSTGLNSEIAKQLSTIASESCLIFISDGKEPYSTTVYEEFNEAFSALKDKGTERTRIIDDKKMFWQALSSNYGVQSFDAVEVFIVTSSEYMSDLGRLYPSYWFNNFAKELSVFYGITESMIKMNVYFDEAEKDKADLFNKQIIRRWNFSTNGTEEKTFSDNLQLINVAE